MKKFTPFTFTVLFFFSLTYCSLIAQNEDGFVDQMIYIYDIQGERALKNFVSEHIDMISPTLINEIVNKGSDKQKLNFLKIAYILAEAASDSNMIAWVNLSTGYYYFIIGDNQKALEMYEKALPFAQQVEDLLCQGNVYQSLGNVYLRIGDNQKSLEMYAKALLFFQQVKNNESIGYVFQSQGDIYSYLGDYQKALEMYEKALAFFEQAESPIGQGEVYLRVGTVYFYIYDNFKALEMYTKALSFFQQVKNLDGVGNVYQSKGDVYLKIGDYQKALEMYEKALPYLKHLGKGNVYLRQGNVYLETGDNQKALEMYAKALPFYKQAGDPWNMALLYLNEAEALSKKGLVSEAKEKYMEGISLFEQVRTNIGFSEMKMSFMDKEAYNYNKLIGFMIDNNFINEAFYYSEALKGRTLLDQLTEKNIGGVDKGLSKELIQKRNEFTERISFLKAELQKIDKHEAKKEKVSMELKLVEEEFDKLVQRIRFENPLYASVNYFQPIAVDSLQRYILKEGEALLEYFISDSSSYVFVITKNSFRVQPLSVSKEKIENTVNDFLGNIKSKGDLDCLLYQILIEPLQTNLKNIFKLIIVPDDILSLLPFEAITDTKPSEAGITFLIEKYEIKYIQSASLLSFFRSKYNNKNTHSSFIGFGDPVYDYENYVVGNKERDDIQYNSSIGFSRHNYERLGGILSRIQGTGDEIKTIANIFLKANINATVFLRENATELNAKTAELKNYGYINFACHGLLEKDFQCLVLSQIPGSDEDGYLSVEEIMNLDLNAKLVVLSACETGKGKIKQGEGVISLTRAVMYAGTPAVVVSLWSVSDKGTKELMIKFFYNLIEKKMNNTDALRKAKVDMIRLSDFSTPYYWSAFVLYGD